MQKEKIIEVLKSRGCRITKQRLLVIDIILENECSCCKEIYYKASKIDSGIGKATVYRLVNTLEEIGAISRKNMYKVSCFGQCNTHNSFTIMLDDNTTYNFSEQKWKDIVKAGLEAYGYVKDQDVSSINIQSCDCVG